MEKRVVIWLLSILNIHSQQSRKTVQNNAQYYKCSAAFFYHSFNVDNKHVYNGDVKRGQIIKAEAETNGQTLTAEARNFASRPKLKP